MRDACSGLWVLWIQDFQPRQVAPQTYAELVHQWQIGAQAYYSHYGRGLSTCAPMGGPSHSTEAAVSPAAWASGGCTTWWPPTPAAPSTCATWRPVGPASSSHAWLVGMAHPAEERRMDHSGRTGQHIPALAMMGSLTPRDHSTNKGRALGQRTWTLPVTSTTSCGARCAARPPRAAACGTCTTNRITGGRGYEVLAGVGLLSS